MILVKPFWATIFGAFKKFVKITSVHRAGSDKRGIEKIKIPKVLFENNNFIGEYNNYNKRITFFQHRKTQMSA